MPNIYIKNGAVILQDKILHGYTISIKGPRIISINKNAKPSRGALTIDAKGAFVSPGFIDCHIHGEPEKIFLNEARHGTTAFVIAQSCAPLDAICKDAASVVEFIKSNILGPNVLGLRLEGPYINKERAGAQDKRYIRPPDARELSEILHRCGGLLKIVTLAPEAKGATPLIKLLRKRGALASIGHSDATYEEALEGIDAGITHATHTFNAMSALDRREPGVIGAVLLDDRVTAEVILDLVHVHSALFGLLVKVKKKHNVIIVTDSLAALEKNRDSPIQRGIDALGQSLFFKEGGAYRFSDGRLAGSCLTMIGALKNAVTRCNMALPDALKLITINPARLLGVDDRKGSLKAGKDADIVVFDKNFDVKMTMIRGRIAFRSST